MSEYVSLVIKVPPRALRSFDRAAIGAGFNSRSAYIWHLHQLYSATSTTRKLTQDELRVLLELAFYENFKPHQPTPSVDALARLIKHPPVHVAKVIEMLIKKKALEQSSQIPQDGLFKNDVLVFGCRCFVTPYGFDLLSALGYTPRQI